MPEVAQTNLQLYNQLIAAGWSDANLDRTQAAYALAADLFAGQIRSSGKTFLEHLVGTASAVAAVGGRPALVHAGLLHATYTFGEFGDGQRNAAESKRAAVRAVIGAEAEELVAEYAGLGYSADTIQDWQQRAHMPESTRTRPRGAAARERGRRAHRLRYAVLRSERPPDVERFGLQDDDRACLRARRTSAGRSDGPNPNRRSRRCSAGGTQVTRKWTGGDCAAVVLASPDTCDPASEARGPQTGCSHSTTAAGTRRTT